MADLTQGAPLPDIKSTTTQTTTAPDFYTNYLNNLANNTTTAAKNAQFVGTQPLQQRAYDLTQSNVGNYQPGLNQAQGAVSNALGTNIPGAAQGYLSGAQGAANNALGTNIPGAAQNYMNLAAAPTSSTVNQFMNPYTQNVVDQIGALGQNNIAGVLAPQTTAGIIGAGQFGSQRGANALAQNVANAGLGITAQQTGALQSGYAQALQAAQNQAQLYGNLANTAGNQAQAQGQMQLAGSNALANLGQIAGNQAQAQGQMQLAGANASQNLAGANQQMGLADVNALSTMGAQQQTVKQNEQLFPLQALNSASNVLRGYTMPTSVTSNYVGPGNSGQYSASPLQMLAGAGTLAGALSSTPAGSALGTKISDLYNTLTGG